LATVPRDQLLDRFPGTQIGIIGPEALTGPDALVAYVGRASEGLAASPQAFPVDTINATPKATQLTALLQFSFVVIVAGLLFPMLILIATATRLSAARREERYAALRLVGATPRQINLIASVDAVVGATFGALAGVGIFWLLRPEIADLSLTGTRFFAADVTPTVLGYLAILLGTPLAAAGAALASLRQVRISPLGVSRKVTPPAPKAWQVLPLLLGVVLFIGAAALSEERNPTSPAALPGFVLIMIGLITAGQWLTMQATRLMVRVARSGPALLAARRLADNPKAAFRSISGLVLAVFIGTIVATIAPTILTGSTAKVDALTNVMAVGFYNSGDPDCSDDCDAISNPQDGLSPQDGEKLTVRLRAYTGVSVFPVYALPQAPEPLDGPPPAGDGEEPGGPISILMQGMSCDSLRQLSLLGQCPAGVEAMQVSVDENTIISHSSEPIVRPQSEAIKNDFTGLPLRAMFVKVNDASSLEKVRTLLTLNAKSLSGQVPRTYGEVRQDELATAVTIQRIIIAATVLTLIIAGCSLAVAVGGGLVERKRPFTLLRLSGVPSGALYKVMLWESVVPLMAVTFVAAGTGFGLAALMIAVLAPAGTPIAFPGLAYSLTIAAGLLVSFVIVCATLPLIGRLTKPDNARFE
ncbi:MAG TPA: FtsX-like permease family protein, partial [Candidatus Saccharimonadales bacterium]|nr:FtsX-like permease family protein [Candidatus Saccharimonadales bacterium]